ncbi:hypothetical protein CDD81_749 [Ophiocordyceps australis]|uniref:WAC domain-containing protein n=1 Tax=Ophiocordyceps australis TaxID=1399860 RepID=A0A2C5Y1M7_9HYPO|nr:hypothetical protein CDD81_749 [Ophiocordyceps australis]
MVLFKRKPVQLLSASGINDEAQEVWHIPQTGEIFGEYEEYLARMDFYKQRRFTDQITGHSGLSFFEAYNSELSGGREVEAAFPEPLKGPILRKVQFQTVSRLDNLVDMIYDEFKNDYYPGEEVTVNMDGGDKLHGLVREKTAFGPRALPDGSLTQPTARYLVNIKDLNEETFLPAERICRDRGVFTKSMLRSFIKKTVTRESWNGAPWLVMHDYAGTYHIDSRIPASLRHDAKIQQRKQLQAQRRASSHEGNNANGHGPNAAQSGPVRLPELKPAPKSHKSKQAQAAKGLRWPLNMSANGANGSITPQDQEGVARDPTPPPPPPPPKYPIEDLLLEPKEGSVRPRLKFMCRDPPVGGVEVDAAYGHIDMDTVGALLETWDTINVYCEIFKLDSFTFDDYIEALQVASEQLHVQLFEEMHCAVLKILVNSELDGGKVNIVLPELERASDDEDGADATTGSVAATPEREPEPKPTGRATRSSLAKLEAERLAAEAAAAEEQSIKAELEYKQRAEQMLQEYDWVEHLRKRDFANGGWQRIIVGLLHQISKRERQQEACESLLRKLVPSNGEPTQEAVRQTYWSLDFNSRVRVLQILCMLTMETGAVRAYMDDCSETMTKYRKERIEWQRKRKQAIEELRQYNDERKALVPDRATPESPAQNTRRDEDEKMTDADESLVAKDDYAEGTPDENGKGQKKRRNRGQAHQDKQRKRDEGKSVDHDKKKEVKAPVKLPPQQMKQYSKLLKEIEKRESLIKACEEEIGILENDLREADCPRTRVLGKDRFWNRYYWFERNGMPYAGLPNSSTAYAEYANGCIWVQGPDDLEREGFIDVPAMDQEDHMTRFNMTIAERKAKEEDGTSVFNAKQWGYICESDDLDRLIRWLDPRGLNEIKLRKELLAYREKISAHMAHRKSYLADGEEQADKKEETVAKRTSTRIRDKTPPEEPKYRCLQWHNSMALDDLGHLHAEQPPPPRARKQTKKREAMADLGGRAPKTRRR